MTVLPRMPARRPSNALLVMLSALIAVVWWAWSTFAMSPAERAFLRTWEAHFTDGHVLLSELNSDPDWDTACVIPAYAYTVTGSTAARDAVLRSYYGPHYKFNWFTTPDVHSMQYGLGFAFLASDRLTAHLVIPSFVGIPFIRGSIVGMRAITVRTSAGVRGTEVDRIALTDLNVSFEQPSQHCYRRESAYIKVIGNQHLLVGGFT